MKLSLSIVLCSRPQSACQKALKHFFSSSPLSRTEPDSLYRRISPLGDPNISVVPVLDQWVREGRSVQKFLLQRIIAELKVYRRFKHALEISQWMTDKRYIPPSIGDMATRLSLISIVHGLEQAEEYYNNKIPQQLKGFEVNSALLNCYARNNAVEKAEGVMQKLRDMGHATIAFPYNILMKLYNHEGSWEKLDNLMHEMEEKGIYADNYTFTIRLTAYATVSDSDGIDMIIMRMESDPCITMDCDTYCIAASAYLKVGLVDKALEMLNKLVRLMETSKRRNNKFDHVLKLYAATGKKDELDRIWNLYKKKGKIVNKSYMSMISSLLRVDDIEGAEKIFEEWETSGLSSDFRILNLMIDATIKHGHLGKAKDLLNRGIAKGCNPSFYTWYCLACGYIENNQVLEAVEALKKAVLLCPPYKKHFKDRLVTCLEYLEGNVEAAVEFTRLLKVEGNFSATVFDRLLNFIKDGNSKSYKHSPPWK